MPARHVVEFGETYCLKGGLGQFKAANGGTFQDGRSPNTLTAGEKISGFGHRVYKTLDPRAPVLKDLAEKLARQKGTARWLQIAERVQVVMLEEMTRRNKRVYVALA